MANELIAILSAKDDDGKANDYNWQVINSSGVIVGDNINVTEINNQAIYRGNFPTGLPAGVYTYRLEKNGEELIAAGTLAWNGTAKVTEAQLAINQIVVPRLTAIDTAIAAVKTVVDNIEANVGGAPLTAAEVQQAAQDAITTENVATEGDVATAVIDVLNAITANQGLTAAQDQVLTLLRDIAEADEVYTPTTAQKRLKGTATVLVDKNVSSSTECNVTTSLIEAP